MDTHGQVFGNNRMAARAHLRCASRVNQCHTTTGAFSLVHGELHELTPGHIRYAATDRLVSVDLHLCDVQIFKGNELVFVDQFAGFLVGEVAPALGRSFVGMAKSVNHLAAFRCAFGKLLFLALQAGDVFGVHLHPALTGDLRSVAPVGERSQPQVNADNLVAWLKWGPEAGTPWVPFTLARKASVPVSNRIPLDGQRLDRGTNRAVQLYPNIPDLGEGQPVAVQPKAGLLEGEAIVPTFTTEAREARLFLSSLDPAKEGLIGQINPLLHVLQDLRMNLRQDWSFHLPCSQELVGIVQGDRLSRLLIGFLADCQCVIVDPSAKLKHFFEARSLRTGWEKSVLVGHSHVRIIADLHGAGNYVNQGCRTATSRPQRTALIHPTVKTRGLSLRRIVKYADQLAGQALVIQQMVTGVTTEQARWKPSLEDWSILEVVNHLYDEEHEDFRTGIEYVLHRPGEEPPLIDPQGWVTARGYNQRDLAESLANFLAERRQSVAWLHGLAAPVWENTYVHPAGFQLRAGDLLSAWVAHDLLHLRQLVELHYAWVKRVSEPFEVEYAGDW
jgi:hypothetical protein